MSNQIGYIDIQKSEINKYLNDAEKKKGVCDVIPAARFSIRDEGPVQYTGMICHPMDMGGEATGIGASSCENCLLSQLNK